MHCRAQKVSGLNAVPPQPQPGLAAAGGGLGADRPPATSPFPRARCSLQFFLILAGRQIDVYRMQEPMK